MSGTSKDKPGEFSDFEKQAMRNRAKELKAEERMMKNKAEGEKALLAVVDGLTEPDKSMITRLHKLIMEALPEMFPKTWYGMPAYANKDGKVVFFFQPGAKFEARYPVFGFNDQAKLDDGNMWATSFALVKLTEVEEKKIIDLVKKSVA